MNWCLFKSGFNSIIMKNNFHWINLGINSMKNLMNLEKCFRWLMQMKVQQTITLVLNIFELRAFQSQSSNRSTIGESNKIFPSISSESKTNFQLNSIENLLFSNSNWMLTQKFFLVVFFFLAFSVEENFLRPSSSSSWSFVSNFKMNHCSVGFHVLFSLYLSLSFPTYSLTHQLFLISHRVVKFILLYFS